MTAPTSTIRGIFGPMAVPSSGKTTTVKTAAAKAATAAKTSKPQVASLFSGALNTASTTPAPRQDPAIAKILTQTATPAVASKADATKADATPQDTLSAALASIGYDPSQFKMETHEDFVSYPGGGYYYKYVSVNLPNGKSEKFSTDLMMQYPMVTAYEQQRMMTTG